MPKVISIVVTYNGAQWVDKCFSSLVQSGLENHQILAIDNGSSDNTLDLLRSNFPSVEVFETGKNLGFGKANNLGFEIARKERAEFVFLLNQDAWIEEGTLESLIEIQQNKPEYGIVSPMQFFDKQNLDYRFLSYLKKYKPNLINRPKETITPIKFVNAAIWLISKECLETVGLFAPIFFHYGEDFNYANRLKYHNLRIGVVSGVSGYHERNQVEIHSTKLVYRKFVVDYRSKALNRLLNINKPLFVLFFEYLYLFGRAMFVAVTNLKIRKIVFLLWSIVQFWQIPRYIIERKKMKRKGAYLIKE